MTKLENQKELETLRDLIKDVETAMLTTSTDEGLVSRPMKTQEVEFDGDLWFFTKKDTDKYHEILHDQDVNIAYAGKSYVSVRGKAVIVNELEKKKELWSPTYEKIMQASYDDPEVVLIKVNAEAAEYWETGNMKKNMLYFYKRVMGKETESTKINETIELE